MQSYAYVLIGLGGAMGGSARFLVSDAIGRFWPSRFPWGTLAVNVSGALLIGIVAGLARVSFGFLGDSPAHAFIVTGLLGGYTTVSSFCMQTLNLALGKRADLAALNVVGSTVLCLIAVAAGYLAVAGEMS